MLKTFVVVSSVAVAALGFAAASFANGLFIEASQPAACPAPAGADPDRLSARQRGVQAMAWPHPTTPALVAILCRHDPFPGWWDSLWIVRTRRGAAADIIPVPLHGTGVDRFAWLDCPGPALAHVVDRTHMGTLFDQVLRLDAHGRIQVVEGTRLPPGTGSARTRVRCP